MSSLLLNFEIEKFREQVYKLGSALDDTGAEGSKVLFTHQTDAGIVFAIESLATSVLEEVVLPD